MHAPLPPFTRQASVYRWMIVVLGFVIAVVACYRFMQATPPANASQGLHKFSVVPPFALTERSGRQITNRDLAGKVWVADFIYTTCPGPCPIVTAGMARLQGQIIGDPHVQLVTFTVDPQTDTPGVLAKYADQFGADKNRWWFLTGPEKPLYSLIQNGFLQAVQDNRGQPAEPGQFTVTHSTYLALVDGAGVVRGFYDGTGTTDRGDLLRDIKLIEQEESQ